MRTTRSNPVIMPNGEQGEQTSREFAMSRQMRPDNAMPIFHSTTGADGLIPGSQKIQHGDDLALTVFTGEQAVRQRDDHLQQGVQFLTEIAHSISDIAHLGKARLLLSQRCFGTPSASSYSVCECSGLPLDGEQTILFCLHGSIQTPLDLSGHMEEMPDISLVVLLPMNLTQGFLDRSASITDGARTADSLFLQIPHEPRPTFSIDLHRGHAGPNLPAVDINHIQIGF